MRISHTDIRNLILTLFLFFMSISTVCAKPLWIINPTESSISFTAVRKDAPIDGKFKTFTGCIDFEPTNLAASSIHIVVIMDSITSTEPTVADTLKLPEWFNVKLYPQADFQSQRITKMADTSYRAEGTLVMRDKTIPVSLTFTLDEYSPTLMTIKGKTTLKRSDFGIGQDDLAKIEQVQDNVDVNFSITAHK